MYYIDINYFSSGY